MNNLINKLHKLIDPLVESLNYELYYLELVKEENENYLRIYIDKQDSNISLDDCEKVSRAVSSILDEKDPISFSYYLEVSSPGIERKLYTDEHFKRYIGNMVRVNIAGLLNGKKEYEGELLDFNSEELKLKTEFQSIDIPRNKISDVSLKVNF
ncbi:MAG: ribosome maturation factor RimP [Clostridium sp.]|jgi:ribosome maturation factor RimP|uniref:ribosome maturation factor RimP n=1 Tax=Clostridium sp. TaxID=1506 RepID=UPI0025BA15C0|nr:ribosome maturation factor RimP [Clostridium sp.]MCH3963986.1 ribosome maturation factor RimP [Clostridium sp.]MCI1716187.1 ribosome maturation factor RimP [Clostridium sp.]MCI1800573.1 ribosome maturation factor RimP [Clostridium sp.]MCI1814364.1 ribosome maturation factor RimP [Clostridium sp.]MCI1871263.1 ribosome maturation factor RimP [Clostridium sp.]